MGYEASLTIEPTKAPLVFPCSAILPGLASRESWENTTFSQSLRRIPVNPYRFCRFLLVI